MFTPKYNKTLRLKWVFLDLDDTLWDFKTNSLEALKTIYSQNVYLHDIFADFNSFLNLYRFHNDRLWELYHHGKIDAQTLKRERFEVLLRATFDGSEAPRRACALNDSYLDTLSTQTAIVEGTESLLRSLAQHALIGVLSNGFINVQYKKLYRTPLWRYVQRMVISDEVGITKPNVRIFRFAELATGAESQTTLMIGDNPDADIAGAVGAGWHAIYLNRRGKACDVDVPNCDSLAQVQKLLF